MIEIKNLSKNFGDLRVLNDISVSVKQGEVIAIIGPSGGGKSTFLRCINRLEEPTGGQISVDGKNILDKNSDINKIRQRISMVFQHFNLFANKSVLENLTLAPVITKLMTKEQARSKAYELLRSVGLESKADAYPHKLSGGQKQRIAIARALAMNPEVILFDEPTSALDPEMIGEVLDIMKEVAARGITMLVVTHEMGFARNVANRIFFMDGGKIAVDDTPKNVFENPQNARLREFLGKVLNH